MKDIFDHIVDWAVFRSEIRINGSFEGLRVNQLPSFDYYMKNCVNDKGGAYDFTIPRNLTQREIETNMTFPIGSNRIETVPQRILISTRNSFWMGTPFNFQTSITPL